MTAEFDESDRLADEVREMLDAGEPVRLAHTEHPVPGVGTVIHPFSRRGRVVIEGCLHCEDLP